MKHLKFTKNKQLLAIVLSVLLVGGCDTNRKDDVTNNKGESVVSFKGARYIRADVDGVDCVIGAGNYDTTVAVSCDWANKSN